MKLIFILAIFFLSSMNKANATPSTIIWIPSVDFQGFRTLHLGIDNYIRTNNDKLGVRGPAVYDIGLTAGILPFKKFQAEVGIDYISMGDNVYDPHPVYFNAKAGFPEGVIFKGAPAIAMGGYNFGIKNNLTDFNLFYAVIAKSIPVIGRFNGGYYIGNGKILLDNKGKKSNSGLLLSWDRNIKEISDKLSFAIDYQGGQNYLGALSIGVTWSFTDKISVIFGYDFYNDHNVTYNSRNFNVNTFNTQLDINF
jgi:hypothetical protein